MVKLKVFVAKTALLTRNWFEINFKLLECWKSKDLGQSYLKIPGC